MKIYLTTTSMDENTTSSRNRVEEELAAPSSVNLTSEAAIADLVAEIKSFYDELVEYDGLEEDWVEPEFDGDEETCYRHTEAGTIQYMRPVWNYYDERAGIYYRVTEVCVED